MSERTEAEPAAGAPRVIKRYANRKLYDTAQSRYVTLDEIGELVKEGAEVQIVDNKTKDDLTAVTLAQIILEEEKKKSRMPLAVLRGMIRSGGETLSDLIQKGVSPRWASLREGAERGLTRIKREGALEKPRELLGSTQIALQEWQKRVDERIHQALAAMTTLTAQRGELRHLGKRLDDLDERLRALEAEKKSPAHLDETRGTSR